VFVPIWASWVADTPDIVKSVGIAVASLGDLFGMKCATFPQRNEVKDYLDIYALTAAGHISRLRNTRKGHPPPR
jgi:hypothetical protein